MPSFGGFELRHHRQDGDAMATEGRCDCTNGCRSVKLKLVASLPSWRDLLVLVNHASHYRTHCGSSALRIGLNSLFGTISPSHNAISNVSGSDTKSGGNQRD